MLNTLNSEADRLRYAQEVINRLSGEKQHLITENAKLRNGLVQNMQIAEQRLRIIDTLRMERDELKIQPKIEIQVPKPVVPVDWEKPVPHEAKLLNLRKDIRSAGLTGETYIARLIEILLEKEHEVKVTVEAQNNNHGWSAFRHGS